MPYTPPAQQSPVASKPTSPVLSRNHSYSKSQPITSNGHGTLPGSPRPGLPRSSSSTSYLSMHRRSPSSPSVATLHKNCNTFLASPESTPVEENFKGQRVGGSSSIRQSPPPYNDLAMPTGAVISPPDSAQNSSDDEEAEKRGRPRKLDNLAELQAAISVIEQNREGSPNSVKREADKARIALGLVVPGAETPSLDGSVSPQPRTARKTSHTRSATESEVIEVGRPKAETPDRSSDSDIEDDERIKKPPMLRKKSGELVRPALRPAFNKRRPSSMPGTPTYSKAVHFDQHLEHVRHFLQVDKPLAVSANNSPIESYDDEMEFPFGTAGRAKEPRWTWEIKLPNFPHSSVDRKHQAVHVERVFLSADVKTLIGTVAVQNLAFNKLVIARFTLDHWKTTSEVTAEYNADPKRPQDGMDRFNFNIRIEDLANIENRTLFFCVRYVVNGQEHWDSNNHVNFQVNFAKKVLSQPAKQGAQSHSSRPLNALPRSRPSPPTSAGKPRPKSTSSFDDFAHGLESFPPPTTYLKDESPIRFRKPSTAPKPSNDEDPASPTLRKKAPSQAFGNRYDFGASLSAAIQAAATQLGDRSGLPQEAPKPVAIKAATQKPTSSPVAQQQANTTVPRSVETNHTKPAALTSGKPDVKSPSYSELLDKYCFFGSSAKTPSQGRPGNGSLDGSADSPTGSSTSSSARNSPVVTPLVEDAYRPAPVKKSSEALGASFGARAASPTQFGYPYHQAALQHGIFPEGHAPTAIRG